MKYVKKKNRVIITEWMERQRNIQLCTMWNNGFDRVRRRRKNLQVRHRSFLLFILLSIHSHCKRSKQECHRTGKIVKIFLCFAKTHAHTHNRQHRTERDLFNLIFGQSSSFSFLHETFPLPPPTAATSKEKTNKNS